MSKRLDNETIIERFRKVHGNRYDYSLVEYKNMTDKVRIICPIHGIFEQTPSNHLKGQNCPKCSHRNSKYSKEEIIDRLKRIYGNDIDYNKHISYDGNEKDMTLYCVRHGYFTKNARLVLQGHGCLKCSINKRRKSKTCEKEKFILKAREIHGNKYIYDDVEYTHSRTKVTIICPIHGKFEQTPNSHLNGSGCPKCASDNRGHNQKIKEEELIRRFNEKHSGKYTYGNLKYNNIYDNIEICCPVHGKYHQMIKLHMSGYGCPKCNQSHSEKEIERILKENNLNYIYQYRCNELRYKSLDFYLPEYNTAIECQGIQHFRPTNFGKDMDINKTYDYIINNDNVKFNICKKIGIKLLYFIYDIKNMNKQTILDKYNTNHLYNEHNLIDNTEELMIKIKERTN